MRRSLDTLLGFLSIPLIAVAGFIGFVALALLARLLVLAWLWILLPLGLAELANNILAIVLAALTAFVGWRLIRFWLPQSGPKLDA